MRVHRSWWVARDAVEQVEQDGRSLRLALRGGVQAPVARSMVPAVKAAGWLSR
jgi:DNA-binding LytR/AlgR family response regulator